MKKSVVATNKLAAAYFRRHSSWINQLFFFQSTQLQIIDRICNKADQIFKKYAYQIQLKCYI